MNSTQIFAPLLHFGRGGASLEEVRHAALRAAALNPGGLVVETESGFADDAEALRAVAATCREYSLALHLDVGDLSRLENAPEEPCAQSLCFESCEVAARDFAAWKVPPPAGALLQIVAVPLAGQSRAPRWENAVALHGENPGEGAASATQLEALREHGDAARLYLMTARDDALASTRGNAFYLDALDEAAARFCIARKLQPLRESLGELWPQVAEIVAAPPHAHRAQAVASPDSELRFPWSRGFAAAFQSLHGYDVLPKLPALVADTGTEAVRVREDFHATVAHLTQQNWWRVLHDWARENGVRFSARACESDAMARALESSGDVLVALHDAATPSVSRPQIEGETDFLHARLAASIAALRGDFGGEGDAREYSQSALARATTWRGARPSASLASRRRRAFSLFHAGVFSLEESAARAALTPQNFASTREVAPVLAHPNAEATAAFNAELARFCKELRRASSGAGVGVLWPSRSLHAHYNPRGHRFTRWVEEDLRRAAKLLDELHFDFLFLPEETLCEAREESAELLCGQARLPMQLIVLPSVTALSRQAWNKLEGFVENGGRVVCLGLLPRWSERGRDEELENQIARATRFHLADAYDSYAATDKARLRDKAASPVLEGGAGFPLAREYEGGGRLCCYQMRLNEDADDARLVVRRMLMESYSPACETQELDVRVSRRVLPENGGDVFFVFNDGAARRFPLRLRSLRGGVPFALDAGGNWKALPVSMAFSDEEGGGIVVTLEMAEGEAQLLCLRPLEAARLLAERANFQVETLDDAFARGYATESTAPQIALREDARVVWRRGESVQVPPPLLLPDAWNARRDAPNALRVFPQDNRATFGLEERIASLWLAVERENTRASTRLRLNEIELSESASPFPNHALWRETLWRWFDLSAARAGENLLRIEGGARRAFLVGEFSLCEDEDEFSWPEDDEIATPKPSPNALPSLCAPRELQLSSGAWSEQGLPNYVGNCEYSQSVFAPREWENCRVFLEVAARENALEAIVNGASCGVCIAPPFRFEITGALKMGEQNEIALRVFGDASPALEDDAPPRGLEGVARIVAYPRVEIALGKVEENEPRRNTEEHG